MKRNLDKTTSRSLISPRARDSWLYFCRGSRLSWQTGQTPHVPPLWFLCLRSILRNIDCFTDPDLIRHVRSRSLMLMWERIRAAELDSVRVWQVFAPALYAVMHEGDASVRQAGHYAVGPFPVVESADKDAQAWISVSRRRQCFGEKRGALGATGPAAYTGVLTDYTLRMTSPTHAWLAVLELIDITPATASDLLAIGDVVNLHSLTVRNVKPADAEIDDRLVRAWSLLAAHDTPLETETRERSEGTDAGRDVQGETKMGRFGVLRQLSIGMQPAVTSRVFQYLNMFPALTEFRELRTGVSSQSRADRTALPGRWALVKGKSVDTRSARVARPLRAPILEISLFKDSSSSSSSGSTTTGEVETYTDRDCSDWRIYERTEPDGQHRRGHKNHVDSPCDSSHLDKRKTHVVTTDENLHEPLEYARTGGLEHHVGADNNGVGTQMIHEDYRPTKKPRRRVLRAGATVDLGLPWLA